MQDLDEQVALVEQRRGGVAVVESELSVVLLDVAVPQRLSVQGESLEDAGSGHDKDRLAVGDRGRGGHVLLAHLDVSLTQAPLPFQLTLFAVDAPQVEVGAVGHVEKYRIAPDNGGGTAEFG